MPDTQASSPLADIKLQCLVKELKESSLCEQLAQVRNSDRAQSDHELFVYTFIHHEGRHRNTKQK